MIKTVYNQRQTRTPIRTANQIVRHQPVGEKIQTFVIVHHQELLLERLNHFNAFLENPEWITWLLVGVKKKTNLLDEYNEKNEVKINYVHCETIKGNIEKNREYLHMTAYQTIYKNNLIMDDVRYIRVVEYDLVFRQSYLKDTQTMLKMNKKILCHKELFIHQHFNKPDDLCDLNYKVMKEVYNIDVDALLRTKNKQKKWMVGINFVMTVDFFNDFFEFFWKNRKYYKGSIQCGNNVERMFTIFCMYKDYSWGFIPYVTHEFCNSHGTSAVKQKNKIDIEKNNAL